MKLFVYPTREASARNLSDIAWARPISSTRQREENELRIFRHRMFRGSVHREPHKRNSMPQ